MIFHVFGTQLCGKTTVTNKVKRALGDKVVSWDIQEDFYIPEGIIVNGEMDWDQWRFRIRDIAKYALDFIQLNNNKDMIIESSGTNKVLNKALQPFSPLLVFLRYPEDHILVTRAEERNLNPESVIEFKNRMQAQLEGRIMPKKLSTEEAIKFILSRIGE